MSEPGGFYMQCLTRRLDTRLSQVSKSAEQLRRSISREKCESTSLLACGSRILQLAPASCSRQPCDSNSVLVASRSEKSDLFSGVLKSESERALRSHTTRTRLPCFRWQGTRVCLCAIAVA